MEVTSTKESKPPSQIRKVFAGTILSFLVGGPIAGGVIGYKFGESHERRYNESALDRAADFEKCIEVVRKNAQQGSETAVVHLAQLSDQEQRACRISISNKPSKDDAKSIEYYLPLDAKLVRQDIDTTLQLPSITELNKAILEAEADAADFNHLTLVGDTSFGVVAGFASGLALSCGAIGIDTVVRRHQTRELQETNITTPMSV